MPWNEVTVMQEKCKFIAAYKCWEGTFKSLCREFGISRKTGYTYIERVEELGLEGLNERSRKPKSSPLKTPQHIEDLIVFIRILHPAWSGDKIKNYLMTNYGCNKLPSEKTIDRIIKRNGLITEEESQKHKPWIRFEHENPNDLWQMDFKGHFEVGMQRCYPLTVLDDHSRFSLLIQACDNQRSDTVKQELITLFRKYGLPVRMTMDNGSPWGYSGSQQHTSLSAWLIQLGIYVSHSRPMHPQTQGKLERFHRTLKLELLSQYSFLNLEEAQEGFDWWQKLYNEKRPHASLENKVPLSRYKASERKYPEKLPPLIYDSSMETRKVQKDGIIYFKGKEYRVGSAFSGNSVGLKNTEEDGVISVYFGHQKVIKIDLRYPV